MVGACGKLAGITVPSLTTIASSVGAISVTAATLGAFSQRTVKSSEAGVALAGPVDANTAVGTVIGASLERAILSNKSWLTEACGVVAITVCRAVIGT